MPLIYEDLTRALPGFQNAVAINVSGGNQALSPACRAIYNGMSTSNTNIAVTMAGGGNITFDNVPSGAFLYVSASAVLQSGTTASNLVALW